MIRTLRSRRNTSLRIPRTPAAGRNSPVPAQEREASTTQSPQSASCDALQILLEIDRLLIKAAAMAQYFGRDAVGNATMLAIRINRMEMDARNPPDVPVT